MSHAKSHSPKLLAGFCLVIFAWLLILSASSTAYGQPFADRAFNQVWAKSDLAIANGTSQATWLWGVQPLNSRTEQYQEAPGGERLVQYFDKGRLEITNPAANRAQEWFVTSGLLVRELVSGRVQVGDNVYQPRTPANVPVAGDLDSRDGPTYATFQNLASLDANRRAPVKSGNITEYLDRNGQLSQATRFTDRARYATYEKTLGHNVPDVFVVWLNNLNQRGFSWQYLVGYPLTEPYWATFQVGGLTREVLVQLFERRALTFDPQNSPQWQVEMANIGLHYWKWRYNTSLTLTASNDAYGLDNEEQKALDLINEYRRANGQPEVTLHPTLTKVARWMSEDMAGKHYFSHTDSLGRDPFKRMRDLGYTLNTYKGENLGAGYESAEAVMTAWKNSPTHNANLLNPNYHVIGLSRIYNSSAPYQWYWSTEYGGQ